MSGELFDSHCHLDLDVYDADRDAVLARARAVGVRSILVPGLEPASWKRAGELSARLDGVHLALGVHPQVLPDMSPQAVKDALTGLGAAMVAHDGVAIGECGFDRGVRDAGVCFARQAAVVDAHLEIARSMGQPVILHVLGAQGEALSHVERHGALPDGGVLHSYSGPAELIPRWLALGLSVSFAGAVTRPSARRPLLAAQAVPLTRLLIETDGPDQTPDGAPERRNEPAFLPLVLEAVARARDESPASLATATTRNARAVFGV